MNINEFIDAYARMRAVSLDNFIACYLAETGLRASEVELVEETGVDDYFQRKTIWYIRPRKIGRE
jgi:Tfp pilus assembly protein PilX